MPHEHIVHPNPHRLSVKIYKKIAIIFLGPVLILAGVVLAATLSRAVITVKSNDVPVTTDAKINIAPQTGTSDTVLGTVFSATLEDTATATPKGDSVKKDVPATGTVTIYNKRSSAQTLVATTRLLSPGGILFRIKDRVNIPAGGELQNVAVYADQPGASGEIAPATFTIPGLPAAMQKSVYASSDAAMANGTMTVMGVSDDDINAAVSGLQDKIAKTALASFSESIRQSGYDGIATTAVEASRQVSAKAGDVVSSFTVQLKEKVTCVVFDRSKFSKIAEKLLEDIVPADMSLKSSNIDVVVPTVQTADPLSGAATLDAALVGTATLAADNGILNKDRLTGLDAASVVGYLKSFGAISDAKVSFWPFWVRKTPSLKSHIEIKIEQ